MPNGGSDHCGNCRHNRLVIDNVPREQRDRAVAFCTVRNVPIKSTHYTYCANHYVPERTPIGPMFASLDDIRRIPYYGDSRPRGCTARACVVCGAPSKANEGVEVVHREPGVLQFCSERHYARWWKAQHPGVQLKWDCDASPEAADPNEARLALAQAYAEMKDIQGAREVLLEVIQDGNPAQQACARARLAELPEQ